MKEYTLVAVVAAVLVVGLDWILGTHVLRRKTFWIFLAVMFAFKLLANGYLTWRPIVMYNPKFFLGVRVFTIPLEDFVYGFGLMSLSVVLWEYFKTHAGARGERMRKERL